MNSKYIDYGYYNSRCIIATPNRADYQITSVDNTILEIKLNNDPLVAIGDKVEIVNMNIKYRYICNKIQELSDGSFLIQESKMNLCNSFIAPLVIGANPILRSSNLYNCYIDSEKSILYVVCKFSGGQEYMKAEEALIKSPNYIKKEDYKNGFVVFEFKIADVGPTVNLFVDGKYSKFPVKLKNKINAIVNDKDIKDVLLRRERRRLRINEDLGITLGKEDELASKPTEKEFYNYFVDNILSKHQ